MITKEQKQEIVAKYGKDANDTGSTEVQIALLTARINDLNGHFKANPKDTVFTLGIAVYSSSTRFLSIR